MSNQRYQQTAWLRWFGVLEYERSKGYGSIIFDFWLNFARQRGYTEARLYTDKCINTEAIEFYHRKGMIEEFYDNKIESPEAMDGIVIFSLSLTDQPIEKWENKFLGLSDQLKKQS